MISVVSVPENRLIFFGAGGTQRERGLFLKMGRAKSAQITLIMGSNTQKNPALPKARVTGRRP